jgi:hypothetical protein
MFLPLEYYNYQQDCNTYTNIAYTHNGLPLLSLNIIETTQNTQSTCISPFIIGWWWLMTVLITT